MAQVDFVPFAAASGANVETQAQYLADAALGPGVSAGLAKSELYNKSIRQATIMASVLAQLISAVTGQNAIDDGTTVTLLANLLSAIQGQSDYVVQVAGSGSWLCPANVYAAEFLLTGGGGGGAGSEPPNYMGGGGGGSGATTIGIFATTPGTSYNYTVGAGGTGAPPGGTTAGSGGATQILVGPRTIIAYGGQGAGYGTINNSAGAIGGTSLGGTISAPGGIGRDGCAPVSGSTLILGGDGASSYWGGQGRAGNANGFSGTAPGAGGGGSYGNNGTGGNGAPGMIRIRAIGGTQPGS